jgi:hypothetical protein
MNNRLASRNPVIDGRTLTHALRDYGKENDPI